MLPDSIYINDRNMGKLLTASKSSSATAHGISNTNGHINESDHNTIILRIRLTDAVLFSHGTRYDIDFNAI